MNINIYLFPYSKRCQQNHTQRPPVFVYLCKLLVVPCAVRLNIQYLFVYLFKSMSTKAHASDHLYLFIYANYLLFHVLIEWIFISICLLIQINVNKGRCKRPPVFVYLCKLPVVSMCSSNEYSYLFVYLFKSMSTKACAPL